MNFERFVGAPVRNPRFCRKITGKGSTQDGGDVVIYKVESKNSLFRQTAEKVDFRAHFDSILEGFWVTFGPLWGTWRTLACLKKCRKNAPEKSFEPQLSRPLRVPKEESRNIPESRVQP